MDDDGELESEISNFKYQGARLKSQFLEYNKEYKSYIFELNGIPKEIEKSVKNVQGGLQKLKFAATALSGDYDSRTKPGARIEPDNPELSDMSPEIRAAVKERQTFRDLLSSANDLLTKAMEASEAEFKKMGDLHGKIVELNSGKIGPLKEMLMKFGSEVAVALDTREEEIKNQKEAVMNARKILEKFRGNMKKAGQKLDDVLGMTRVLKGIPGGRLLGDLAGVPRDTDGYWRKLEALQDQVSYNGNMVRRLEQRLALVKDAKIDLRGFGTLASGLGNRASSTIRALNEMEARMVPIKKGFNSIAQSAANVASSMEVAAGTSRGKDGYAKKIIIVAQSTFFEPSIRAEGRSVYETILQGYGSSEKPAEVEDVINEAREELSRTESTQLSGVEDVLGPLNDVI
ncbi:hypothetical protein Dda_6882 [Drechslerella dactyloides]|uniref:Uncharacterized protein n=1 Tax=Drechslerella dactyloides TaxID=74499 RepID=A0AAD6IUB7_DREDA|nr:hypothetical protein Dda_6882 [Drechslerella dactyloides]